MKHVKKSQWENDFMDFIQSEEVRPPQALTQNIMSQIHSDLHPSEVSVFRKAGALHLIAGIASLFLCPQFGLGLTELSFSFFHLLHQMNWALCMFVCGSLFLGAGSLATGLLLRPEELRVLSKNGFVQFPLLTLMLLGILLILSPTQPSFVGALLWSVGGVAGMTLLTSLALKMRIKSYAIQNS